MNATAPNQNNTTTNTNGSMTELVSGIISDAQTLIKQQFAMLRAETKQDIDKCMQAGKFMGVGAALSTVGVLFLAVSLVHLLNWAVPTLPYFACWAIVGAAITACGVAALVAGKQQLSTGVMPDKSLHALQENISWITNRQTASNAT